jgi:hypothetical protein
MIHDPFHQRLVLALNSGPRLMVAVAYVSQRPMIGLLSEIGRQCFVL